MSDDSRIRWLPAAGIVVIALVLPVLLAHVQPTFVAGVDNGVPTAELESFPEDVQRNLTAAADGNRTVTIPSDTYPESFTARIGGNPLFDGVSGGGLVVGDDVVIELEVETVSGITVSATNRTDDAVLDPATLSPRGRAVYNRATAADGPVAFYTARPSAFRDGVDSGATTTFVIDRDGGNDTLVIERGSTSVAGVGATLAATLGGLAVVPAVVRSLARRRGRAVAVGGAILVAAGPPTLARVAAAGVPPSLPLLVGRVDAEFPTAAFATAAALVVVWWIGPTASGDGD